jgi:septum formation protein
VTPVVLASASPSRAALLRAAGLVFSVVPSCVDEAAVKAQMLARGAGPAAVAQELAELKARDVSQRREGLVIGADQTLDLDGVLYDKPRDGDESRDRLRTLRGRPHGLHAAVAVAHQDRLLWTGLETATLWMRDFSDTYLDAYLGRNAEEVVASTGAYLLEGEGIQLFDRIDGDYFAILGLPLLGLLAFLRRAGALPT